MPTFADFDTGAQVVSGKIASAPSFPEFIDSLEQTESNGGVNTWNARTGATGSLQVTPIAAREVGGDYSRAVSDPAYARGLGVQYAKKLWSQFNGDPSLTAAAYHTGPTQIRKLLSSVPKGEDPTQWVVSQLDPEGKGHNKKVMGRFTKQVDYDPEEGVFTEANAGKIQPTFNDFVGDLPTDSALTPHQNKFLNFAKQAGVETANVADMFASWIPFTVGTAAGTVGTAIRLALGESPNTAYVEGRKSGQAVAEPFSNPIQKVFNMLNSGDVYEGGKTVKAISAFSDAVKRGDDFLHDVSGGKIPTGSFEQFVDVAMAATPFGPKAVKQAKGAAALSEARPTYEAGVTKEAGGMQRPTFKDFTAGGGVEQADAFIKSVLEDSAKEEVERQKATRLKTIALGAAAPIGTGAAYLYQKLTSPGNQVIDPQQEEHEVPFPKPGNEVAGRTVTSDEYDKLMNQFGSLAAIPFAIGAVKGKGGTWHPEAPKRLAQSIHNFNDWYKSELETGLTDTPERVRDLAILKWSDRSTRNYLNKYAGTEGDPLKNVEISSGVGTKKWSDVIDSVIVGKNVEGPRGSETQWKISDERGGEQDYSSTQRMQDLNSHLSHVGDYLRQNVDPDKLQQYDLVRAVKETAKNDERVAKEMEKAASVSTKDLPVYKEYPDGMKWVELKLPEKLTEKQVGRIGKTKDYDGHTREGSAWENVALDDKGKPIQNTYTGELASGRTPEEAHLAGQLAQEGNQMGHCVGGYCEGVASGESRIFSLRDAKGRSHVTIEVQPGRMPGAAPDSTAKDSILQIKGKQNRAPVAEYLPYVQDFVKSGKWGDVGDLGNTGLYEWKRRGGSQTPYVYKAGSYDPADVKLESGYYTSSELHSAITKAGGELDSSYNNNSPKDRPEGLQGGIGRRQQGSADIRLVKALALAGVGATIGASILPDDRLTAALVGGVLALGLGHTKVSALPQLLAPGSKLARSVERKIAQATETFIRTVNPDLMGKQAESAGSVLGKVITDSMRKELGIEMGSIPRYEFWMRQGETRSRAFMKAYEKGTTFTNPELNTYAIGYRDWMNRLSQYEQGRNFTYDPVDNYLYHVWEDPEAVTAYFNKKYGAKWGDPGFVKDRNFKLIEDGEAAGFKLKTWNPETLAVMRQHASNAASLKADSLAELAKYGLAKEVEKGLTAAPGETLWRSPNGQLYFLPDQVNQVMHNAFNTKSLWADTGLVGTAFRATAYAKNILVPIQLFGLFHPMHVQLGPSFSDAMTAITKLVAAGKANAFDLAGAGISKLALADIYNLPKLGSDYVGALRGEIPYSKLTEPQKYGLTLMTEGSFNPIMPIEYRNRHVQDFRQAVIQAQEALQHGRPIDTAAGLAKSAWNLPWVIMEKFYTGPIFERWIPNVKSAAYLRDAYAALAANPQLLAQPLERMNALRRIAKQVDDRFGEMNYRTLFMNRTVKDLGVMSLLSYGWQAAFLRSYIGAVPELARVFQTLGEPYQPKRLGGPEVITTPSEISKNLELSRLAAGMQKFHESKSGFDYSSGSGLRAKIARGELDKVNNVMYYVMSTMFYGGLMTYAMTGQAPGQLMDYIFPLSGEKNADGSPARLSTPFYTKDYVAYPKTFAEEGIGKGMLKIVGHKLNPAIGMIDSIVRNKDFFNREIRDPNAGVLDQISQTLKFMTTDITPMSVGGPAKGPPGLKGQVLGVAGFNPAPKYVTDSPIEQKIKHEYGKYHNSVVPYAQAKKADDRSELYRLKQLGKEPEFEAKLLDMKDKYKLKANEETNLRRNAEIPTAERLFTQLPNKTQEKLLSEMTAADQARFRPRAGKELRYQ